MEAAEDETAVTSRRTRRRRRMSSNEDQIDGQGHEGQYDIQGEKKEATIPQATQDGKMITHLKEESEKRAKRKKERRHRDRASREETGDDDGQDDKLRKRKHRRKDGERKKRRKSRRDENSSTGVENPAYQQGDEMENHETISTESELAQASKQRKDSGSDVPRLRKSNKSLTQLGVQPFMVASLEGLEDDLYSVSGEGEGSTLTPSSLLVPNFPSSQLVSKLYTEKQGRFSSTGKRKLTSLATPGSTVTPLPPPAPPQPSLLALQLAITCQKVFRCIATNAHGLLAGIGFWQIIIIYLLHREDRTSLDYIDLYSPISHPFQVVFYLLNIVCAVSVFDRYDVSEMSVDQLKRMFLLRSGGLSIVLYTASLLITLSTGNLDDKLSLYSINATLYSQMDESSLKSEIHTWQGLTVSRCVLVVAAWILLSIRPNTDLLHKHLTVLKQYTRSNSKESKLQTVKLI